MDKTGRDMGGFNGELGAKLDGEGGGTGHCLKHNEVLSSLLEAVLRGFQGS